MSTAVARIARQIETALMDQSGPRELALLHDYLTACRRNSGAVFAVSPDLVMSNDRARELIDPADQATLIAGAIEAMNSERRVLLLDLPCGAVARVQVRPSWVDRGDRRRRAAGAAAAPRCRSRRAASPCAGSRAAGRGRWRAAVDEVLPGRRPALPQPRVARSCRASRAPARHTIARATHQPRTPAAHLRILDAEDYGPELGRRRRRGARDRLRHARAHPPRPAVRPGRQALVDALEPYRESTEHDRPWLVATVAPGGLGRPDDPVDLLEFFPRTVVVPPLRHHVEDVAELVPHFIARLTRGADLSCSPEAMRLLMRNRWPGNVEQLYQVLRKTVARRRAGRARPRRPAARGAGDHPPGAHARWRRSSATRSSTRCWTTTATRRRPPATWACPAPRSTARSAATASRSRTPPTPDPLPSPPGRLAHNFSVRAGSSRGGRSELVRLRGTHSVNPAARASVAVRNQTWALVRA